MTKGRYGIHGGQYIPEILMDEIHKLEEAYEFYKNDKDFEPESVISRQQLASVLYLYAQFKGYDVSVGEETNILSYDDCRYNGYCGIVY